ncbi:hypothetical protein BABINDRAFT_163463 [Babjeviella inositovora NRRL Y-12698]|uniref:Uncharacterized protein n=1 Tax=Babjeviella inositovora NRRL Y-12698 TaxID=984486 RepID=A0A1E3QIH3_9ASCO|nr:uncharacterized protein BABINDRAFT_163463 [Babjeviella inositovora NRRL Y-12698]ODQ77440.1 hypothetical protein BABINDRAFT_163463 [Babjeviella inositovora NRRL Y-12698]
MWLCVHSFSDGSLLPIICIVASLGFNGKSAFVVRLIFSYKEYELDSPWILAFTFQTYFTVLHTAF